MISDGSSRERLSFCSESTGAGAHIKEVIVSDYNNAVIYRHLLWLAVVLYSSSAESKKLVALDKEDNGYVNTAIRHRGDVFYEYKHSSPPFPFVPNFILHSFSS